MERKSLKGAISQEPREQAATICSGEPSPGTHSSGTFSFPLVSLLKSEPVSSAPRYEEEVALRATAENEFVTLKKVSGS